MKPVAIFRHSASEGPGYFATFLEAHSLPWTQIDIDQGAEPPAAPDGYSGLCFMGGPMSVNDDVSWIAPLCALIRAAVERGVPVLGHCLGGQLMSKALGGTVSRNAVKELGWGEVVVTDPAARNWLADISRFEAFHWHGETFSIPSGATRILGSPYCENQAFILGPHLGLQCHVEMTEAMIRLWCRHWHDEGATPGASVQTPQQMLQQVEQRIASMRLAADKLYGAWISGLRG